MADIVITEQSHPALYKAFLEVELDNGAGHVGTTHPSGYDASVVPVYEPRDLLKFEVPAPWTALVDQAETSLTALLVRSEPDFLTFVCGEQSEAEAIMQADAGLDKVQKLINGWFNDWPADEEPHD